MIGRDLAAAAEREHDLAIVGGGAYGIALALESSRRGLQTLLVERGDYGGETSWNTLRILHGGLRYLQSLDLPRFFESVEERRFWLEHFPDLAMPLACLMPLYGDGARRPSVMRLALALNDLLSSGRNRGLRSDRRLPGGTILSPEQAAARAPAIERRGLLGAALWCDATVPHSQRLLVEMLHWAQHAGAVTLNYVEAREVVVERGRLCALLAVDRVSGEPLRARCRALVNCAGPWSREVAQRFDRDVPELFHPSLAFNLVLDREPLADAALAVRARAARAQTLFLCPWQGRTMAGTFHAAWQGGAPPRGSGAGEDVAGTGASAWLEPHIDRFLSELDAALPGQGIGRAAVLRVCWGQLPARWAGSDRLARRPVVHDHGRSGGPRGLFSVSGIKLTTARAVAEKTLRAVCAAAGRSLPPAGVQRPAPFGWLPLSELLDLARRDEESARARVEAQARSESVVCAEDLLLRRSDWGVDPVLARGSAERVSRLLSGALPGGRRPSVAAAQGGGWQ